MDAQGLIVNGVKNYEDSALTGDKKRATKDGEILKFSVEETGTYYLKVGTDGQDSTGGVGGYRLMLEELGNSRFSPLRVLNSMPDIEIKSEDSGSIPFLIPVNMFHHYDYAVGWREGKFFLSP